MMSFDYTDESVYSLIPPPEIPTQKEPLFISMYNKTRMREVGSQKSETHNTIGKPDGSYMAKTDCFLKKMEKCKTIAGLKTKKSQDPFLFDVSPERKLSMVKPPISKHDELVQLNERTKTNFPGTNAIENMMKRPPVRPLTEMEKDYTKIENYGKTPSYLTQVQADIEKEYKIINKLKQLSQEETSEIGRHIRKVEETEKKGVISSLESKLERLNRGYQAETHIRTLDTISKVKRKERFETEIKELESKITQLQKKDIYVHMER